ncbi:MAG TPA: ABC transporter permease, partial [Burkholderiales bacterium]|nr:ABC transporter permease [Burkholderiales bacterium]
MTLWSLAAQRLRRDRVGTASAAIVLAFLLVAIASGAGLLARDWGQEVAVSYAPPGFVEASSEQTGEAKAPQEDYGIPDPLALELAEIKATLSGATGTETKATALAFGADKWGRDVLKKVIKGTETSLLVGFAAAALATFLGTLFGALAGYYGRWVDDLFN